MSQHAPTPGTGAPTGPAPLTGAPVDQPLDALVDGLVVVSATGLVLQANRAARESYGLQPFRSLPGALAHRWLEAQRAAADAAWDDGVSDTARLALRMYIDPRLAPMQRTLLGMISRLDDVAPARMTRLALECLGTVPGTLRSDAAAAVDADGVTDGVKLARSLSESPLFCRAISTGACPDTVRHVLAHLAHSLHSSLRPLRDALSGAASDMHTAALRTVTVNATIILGAANAILALPGVDADASAHLAAARAADAPSDALATRTTCASLASCCALRTSSSVGLRASRTS